MENVEQKVSMLGKEIYPRKYEATVSGYKIKIRCYGVYNEFVMGIAQAGDPKGSVEIIGPDINLQYGNRIFPANLMGNSYAVRAVNVNRLANKFIGKYHREPNLELLTELLKAGLKPYVGEDFLKFIQ